VTRAAALDPANLTYAAWRIETLLQLQRWDDVQTAVEAYKAALRHNGQNVADAHVASGRGHQMRGNLPRALHEYRTAAALAPDRSELWRAVAQTAEALGDVTSAIEAYRTLTRLSPKDEPARASLQRLEQARASARLREALTP
jgi:tetratricopeptide (TPR) repeat protein